MSDIDGIEITKYNSIDSVSLNIPDLITDISISYDNRISAIDIDYTNEITDIVLSLGNDIQSVYSVNNLTGYITLSASSTLPVVTASQGIYSYQFNHNLNSYIPSITLFNTNNQIVFADIEVLNSNSVTIKALVDLFEYKVVAQI